MLKLIENLVFFGEKKKTTHVCVFWFVLGSYIIFFLLLIDFIFSFLDKFKMGFGWFHTYKNKRLCKRENKWFFERKGSFGFG